MRTALEKKAKQIADAKQNFERVVVTKEECLQLYKSNPFKTALISSKLPEGSSTTVYRNGTFIDLCKGPHLPTTGRVKAFAIDKTSSALWLGKQGNDTLQRVYGISFADKKELAEWKLFQEEAKKRDHRKIGEQQDLFFFDDLSPGSCFFLPHGARIYNKLMEIIKREYFVREYTEVVTPNMYNLKLWQTSGHAAKCAIRQRAHRRPRPRTPSPIRPRHHPVPTCPLSSPPRGYCMPLPLHHPVPTTPMPTAECAAPCLLRYKENMFCFDIEGQEFGLKPMNCPGHCIMFKNRLRSYRELPMRFADFGTLHRNELSGALTGLTRVRRFQQDDAHIFCRIAQIKEEVAGVLDMISTCYKYFGMTFALKLSTKPETALGDADTWAIAEQYMTEALNEFKEKTGHQWSLNPGDGAFYGPKIDVQVFDALKRAHQCATVQLDFVQPMRFDLKYQAPAGEGGEGGEGGTSTFERPVMIHRAVLGSVERMIAILTEHYAGKWPFFLSPRQAMVVPVSKAYEAYAQTVQRKVRSAGFHVDADLSHQTLNKMVRNSQQAQYNFILVVGAQEETDGTVNVRTRNNAVHGTKTIDELIVEFKQMEEDHTLDLQLDVTADKKEAK